MGFARSPFQRWKRFELSSLEQEDKAVLPLIIKTFHAHRRRYGTRRIMEELRDQGIRLGRKRIAKLMKIAGVSAIQPKSFKPKTTQSKHTLGYNENLIMNLKEGRIQRFGGLAIRRGISKNLGSDPLADLENGKSPWHRISEIADKNLSDESGLMPWWVCPDGGVKRYVFHVPSSEQNHWFHWIQEQRLLYRLALGQPNQEDLLEVRKRNGQTNAEDVRDAVVNLSPWFSKKRNG